MNKLILFPLAILATIAMIAFTIQYHIEWIRGQLWLMGFKYRHVRGQVEEYFNLLVWYLMFIVKAYVQVLRVLLLDFGGVTNGDI